MSNLNDPPGRTDAIVTDAAMLTADIKGLCPAAADKNLRHLLRDAAGGSCRSS
jgi:hypothetical protein